MTEIINRVEKSPLITIDLEEFYPKGKRVFFDLKDFLFEGLLLKEKEFRTELKNHDWSQYKDCYVALGCSTDAIVPAWAYLLVTTYLQPYSKKIVQGDISEIDKVLYLAILNQWDVSEFKDKKVIIKGCSKVPVPEEAYIELTQKLMPLVQSLMYGEACSTVPLFKKK